MTQVIFEEAGKLMGGRLLSQTQSSAQVELDSGRRLKVKLTHVLARYEQESTAGPAAQMLAHCEAQAAEVDLQLAWEFAPEAEFDFAALSAEYFGAPPPLHHRLTMLIALQKAPHYFRRGSKKGSFRKAEAASVAQALAAMERRERTQAQIHSWAQELQDGTCPEPVARELFRILFKPDKNAPEYKAVVLASRASDRAPLQLLQAAGALGQGASGAYQFHWQRFAFANPHLRRAPTAAVPVASAALDELPVAEVAAFSIDDSATTEIDDALSVQGLGSDTVVLGIHIAAPALAIAVGDAVDCIARERYSSVYMPGEKITMLPDELVRLCTLEADSVPRPAVSLYVHFEAATLALKSFESRVERVPILANLRYDRIDHVVTPPWLQNEGPDAPELPDAPGVSEVLSRLRAALSWLWTLAQHLKAQREHARGKPQMRNRPDYSFRIEKPQSSPVTGEEQVAIVERMREAPLDAIVTECMIVANSTWGEWLASLGVPAIYRSQDSLSFGSKVRMGTRSLPHAGLGVRSYAWSTSPLRRYVDLVNQWQIVAAIRSGVAAAMAAPFKPRDVTLSAISAGFEEAHQAYGDFQAQMERFWTLRYLQQRGLTELRAVVLTHAQVRVVDLPLILPVAGAATLARGTAVRVRLGTIDLMNLGVTATLVAQLPQAQAVAAADTGEMPEGEERQEEMDGAAPSALLQLAIDTLESQASTYSENNEDNENSETVPAGQRS